MPPDDPLLLALRALPPRKLDARASDRVLRRARAVLVEEKRGGPLDLLETLWRRAIAPTLVTATVAGYLFWAIHSASALVR